MAKLTTLLHEHGLGPKACKTRVVQLAVDTAGAFRSVHDWIADVNDHDVNCSVVKSEGADVARRPSLRSVARLADVSYQTVSRVLNGQGGVHLATRQRVMEAIETLDYRPNRAARELVTGHSQWVSVLTTQTTLYGYSATIEGIEEAARRQGFMVCVTVIETSDPNGIEAALARACEPVPAGLIVITFDVAGAEALRRCPPNVRGVVVGSPETSMGHPCAAQDEYAGAFEATKYLLQLGHRTVHHIAIPAPTHPSLRERGWVDALTRHGAPVTRAVRSGWDAAFGYSATEKLLRRTGVTAIFCGNDELALGVISALLSRGISVPDDISVVGFDDIPSAP